MRRFKAILLNGERYKVLYDSVDACDVCDLSKYCHPAKDHMQYICALTIGADIYFKRAEGK